MNNTDDNNNLNSLATNAPVLSTLGLLSFHGRRNVKTYFIMFIILGILMRISLSVLKSGDILGLPFILLLNYIHITNISKRLHDINLPTYYSYFFVLPFICGYIFGSSSKSNISASINIICTIACFYLMCKKSNVGDNEYGPEPK